MSLDRKCAAQRMPQPSDFHSNKLCRRHVIGLTNKNICQIPETSEGSEQWQCLSCTPASHSHRIEENIQRIPREAAQERRRRSTARRRFRQLRRFGFKGSDSWLGFNVLQRDPAGLG
ncbi:hypothetical protein DPEC_G00360120 [Dallia pectoralis]|uniref:Uncharacterized protein n=1 Tax=Dallia pectoralis TaxID=75939 RepID=A0ACC2F0U1_DALPE|nr:hypothetical protein DPEC_G00360120 [Dallia pectoralis]